MTNSYQGYGPDEMPTAPQAQFGGSGPAGGGHRRRWAAVLAITAVVVGGGAFAAAEAATGSPAAPAALTASQSSASTQAATATKAKEARRHGRLARLRRVGGEYGQVTFATKTGTRTLAFERGTIESVSGNDVVVRTRSGVTESWTLTGKSVVRQDGKRTTNSALASGELVFTGGPVTGSTRDVRLIVIGKAAPSSAQPTT